MSTDQIVDSTYVMAIQHAINRLEGCIMAGEDIKAALEEFKKWKEEQENE